MYKRKRRIHPSRNYPPKGSTMSDSLAPPFLSRPAIMTGVKLFILIIRRHRDDSTFKSLEAKLIPDVQAFISGPGSEVAKSLVSSKGCDVEGLFLRVAQDAAEICNNILIGHFGIFAEGSEGRGSHVK